MLPLPHRCGPRPRHRALPPGGARRGDAAGGGGVARPALRHRRGLRMKTAGTSRGRAEVDSDLN